MPELVITYESGSTVRCKVSEDLVDAIWELVAKWGQLPKPMKKESYHCPACGKRVKALARPWCHCQPRAPFHMIPESTEKIVSQVFKRMK